MATLNIQHTFVAGTPAEAQEVNQNFTDVRTFVNTQVVHRDGTNPFTVMPVLPSGSASAVTTNAHAANKAYVDSSLLAQRLDLINVQKPVNVAWGHLGSAKRTSTQTVSSTSLVDLTGLSTAVTIPLSGPIRRFKVSAFVPAAQVSNTGFVATLYLTDMFNNVLAQVEQDVRNANDVWGFSLTAVLDTAEVFSAGSSFKLRGSTSVGSTSWRVNASATRPAVVIVEDVGV
jgi:hypothetical protein